MSDREELFQIIWDGAVDDRVKDGKSPEKVPVVRPKVWALVHGILAAGFRKPRIVTTSDELDELSNKALIMTRHGEYREAAKTVLSGNIWRGMGPTKVLRSAELAAWHLPATVLHEGEGEE